ncbi:hypothetical protein DDB_G0275379 [Dictyostelium discoideum AX4]|uniref:Uncharacterized protein n=1 Tax=Dictyostelium discoideum TaxID=44689 RepID=Q553P7_DICDI|nr:hypothetical protein DDB_G0275379 [Dictyostelium discoideum AX4]EAL69755.1 hypothetical protein DDB_G0275379 [Dictyostelium discoideum AX4]|eukprot:XP_643699.1 hypothetical protein DDB_G0275379 [Dictyostelium discoideum AX4]
MNSCIRLFNQNISGNITRSISNFKKHSPRSKLTRCILSNGATIRYWTSLPMSETWRCETDIFNNPPEYVMDNIQKIKEKRKSDLDERFRQYKK